MKKALVYFKFLGIFALLEIFVIFLCSLLNLFLLSSNITTIVLLLFNISIFILFGLNYGKTNNKKGLVSGLIMGTLLVVFLSLINIIFYKYDFNINRILYYLILILSSTLGGIIGKNLRKEN